MEQFETSIAMMEAILPRFGETCKNEWRKKLLAETLKHNFCLQFCSLCPCCESLSYLSLKFFSCHNIALFWHWLPISHSLLNACRWFRGARQAAGSGEQSDSFSCCSWLDMGDPIWGWRWLLWHLCRRANYYKVLSWWGDCCWWLSCLKSWRRGSPTIFNSTTLQCRGWKSRTEHYWL